jgi:hypothetical protein
MTINFTILITVIAVLVILIGTPILLLYLGIKQIKTSRSTGGKILIGIGVTVLLVYLTGIGAYVIWVGPGQSRILTQGKSPEGLEYCVVQTFKDLVEPYQVSFYIRDTNRLWRWNYLEHEDVAWRSAAVDFSNGLARVSRNGIFFREVPLPTNVVDLATVLPGYLDEYCPSNFTVEEVFKYHSEHFK